MLLAVDVGNTRTKAALFAGETIVVRAAWPTDCTASEDVIAASLRSLGEGLLSDADHSVVACVVPSLKAPVLDACARVVGCPAISLDAHTDTGLVVAVRHPETLGPDRIADAVAASAMLGCHAVAVDFGTATTFTVVSPAGELLGGAIAPGLRMAAESLAARTGQLPLVDVMRPDRVIGNDTRSSIQSGLYYGWVGMTREILRRIADEMGQPVPAVSTGGLASVVTAEIGAIDRVAPDLTLNGLRMIAERAVR